MGERALWVVTYVGDMDKQLVAEPEIIALPSAPVQPLVKKAVRERPPVDTRRSRSFFGNRFVYAVISQRASGLSIGVNLNPDQFCNFDCAYCEIDRRPSVGQSQVNKRVETDVLSKELKDMLSRAFCGRMRELPGYERLPDELLNLKEVALSGDGEPTLCPNFEEVVETVVHLRALSLFPFFKIVLITNATGLHLPEVQHGLSLFTAKDQIWAKLETGSEAAFQEINRPSLPPIDSPDTSMEHVMRNILAIGQQRPVVIQSLFPAIDGKGPTAQEIEAYVQRLQCLKEAGAQISLVQVYSAHRVATNPRCSHLPLKSLSEIARRVREVTGLRAEVF
jgi:wyosine [tRNA(Phe)-imidazoG37] synthetase (radical SAM superfamily)